MFYRKNKKTMYTLENTQFSYMIVGARGCDFYGCTFPSFSINFKISDGLENIAKSETQTFGCDITGLGLREAFI